MMSKNDMISKFKSYNVIGPNIFGVMIRAGALMAWALSAWSLSEGRLGVMKLVYDIKVQTL